MIITAFIGYVLPWGWLISPKYFIYDTLFPFQFTFAGPTSCVPIFDWPPAAWPSYAVHDWARLGTDCKFGGSELYSVLSLRDSSTLGSSYRAMKARGSSRTERKLCTGYKFK